MRKPDTFEFWPALRKFGNVEEILYHLAKFFNSSLLGNYRCLSFALSARSPPT
jgi:hypothetical protein